MRAFLQDKCSILGPVEQRHFLLQLGISVRLKYLLRQCPDKRDYLLSSAMMLLGSDDEGGMGERFKSMAIFPKEFKFNHEQRIGFIEESPHEASG